MTAQLGHTLGGGGGSLLSGAPPAVYVKRLPRLVPVGRGRRRLGAAFGQRGGVRVLVGEILALVVVGAGDLHARHRLFFRRQLVGRRERRRRVRHDLRGGPFDGLHGRRHPRVVGRLAFEFQRRLFRAVARRHGGRRGLREQRVGERRPVDPLHPRLHRRTVGGLGGGVGLLLRLLLDR